MDVDRLLAELAAEGVEPGHLDAAAATSWSNGPGDRYGAHEHPYDKVLVATEGSITFRLVGAGRDEALVRGGRLELPAHTVHAAIVGPAGVSCLEVHLPAGALESRHRTGRDEGGEAGAENHERPSGRTAARAIGRQPSGPEGEEGASKRDPALLG